MARPILLVTGGSRGIGAAVARLAARQGYDVAINYLANKAAAETVAKECRAAGARAEIMQGDMAKEADIARVFAEVDTRLGRLTHLVNNAGITGKSSRFTEMPPAAIRDCVDLNVTGAMIVAQEAIRRMSKKRGGAGGAIVSLSSAAATLGAPGEFVWYAASKAAIDAMTIGLAKEYGPEGIRVNAVAPGLIDTEIHLAAGDPGRLARLLPTTPLGRIGTAQEVADTILYLLSDASSYVTGAILRVTGGR